VVAGGMRSGSCQSRRSRKMRRGMLTHTGPAASSVHIVDDDPCTIRGTNRFDPIRSDRWTVGSLPRAGGSRRISTTPRFSHSVRLSDTSHTDRLRIAAVTVRDMSASYMTVSDGQRGRTLYTNRSEPLYRRTPAPVGWWLPPGRGVSRDPQQTSIPYIARPCRARALVEGI